MVKEWFDQPRTRAPPPAYGEQMGSHWMNVARCAESDGFLDDDRDRLFWPYRDGPAMVIAPPGSIGVRRLFSQRSAS